MHILNGVGSGGDCCQHRVILPVIVSLNAPVEAQHHHQNDHHDPEESTEPGLVSKEYVDQTLN